MIWTQPRPAQFIRIVRHTIELTRAKVQVSGSTADMIRGFEDQNGAFMSNGKPVSSS
jgi:hypothetical protein